MHIELGFSPTRRGAVAEWTVGQEGAEAPTVGDALGRSVSDDERPQSLRSPSNADRRSRVTTALDDDPRREEHDDVELREGDTTVRSPGVTGGEAHR